MDSFLLILLAAALIGVLLGFILYKFIKKSWVKFLPGFIGLSVIAYLLYQIYFTNLEGFTGLGYMLLAMIIGVFVLGNFIFGWIINWKKKERKEGE